MRHTCQKLFFHLLLWTACIHTPAWGQSFELGLLAAQEGNYVLAAQIWYPLAEQGDAKCQFGMGTLFHEGLGVEQELTESAYWFHRAAEQGLAEAQYNLGNAYKHGEGVGQSDTMAVIWWRRAAEQSFSPAQFNLATALLYGRGTEEAADEALLWYRRAAEQGHAGAREALAGNMPPAAAVAPAPAPATGTANAIDTGDTDSCSHWLAGQSPGGYTVQLMSSPEAETIAHNARQLSLPGQVMVCSYPHKGTIWHALLWGSYRDKATAEQAVASHSDSLPTASPWIRSLDAIRKLHARKP